MRRFALTAAGIIAGFTAAGSLPLLAQAPPNQAPDATPPPGRVAQWRCVTPAGTFAARLNAIVAVAMHEYIVDGAARVTEVNIDTTGNTLARFYYLEPVTPQTPMAVGQSAINKLQDLAKEAAGKTGQEEVWKKVVKTYPGSTHAHTVEYRLDSREALQKVFDSADKAFREAKDTMVTIP